jgi:hypothetical protein
MGSWGTGIFDNDEACDVRDLYRALLANKVTDDDAMRQVLDKFADATNPDAVWIALAASQWKLGRLVPEVRDRSLEVIDSGHELDETWEGELQKRKTVLERLRVQLISPQPQRRVVRKPWRDVTDLKPGDVLAIRLNEELAAALRVIWIEEDMLGWRTPLMEVFAWEAAGPPSVSALVPMPPVTSTRGFVWHVRCMRLRKRDQDWRDAGFALIDNWPVTDRVNPIATTGFSWASSARHFLSPNGEFMKYLAHKNGVGNVVAP